MAEGGYGYDDFNSDSHSHSRPPKVQILCKYFMHGACHKGNNCRFLHDRTGTAPLNNVCKFYQQGNCSYGKRCRYDHVRVGNSSHLEASPQNYRNGRQNGPSSHSVQSSQCYHNGRRNGPQSHLEQSPQRYRNGQRNNLSSHFELSPQRHRNSRWNGPQSHVEQSPQRHRNGRRNEPPSHSEPSPQRYQSGQCKGQSKQKETKSQIHHNDDEWQSSMVTLKGGRIPESSPNKKPSVQSQMYVPKNWAKAKDFVPGEKFHAGATYAKAIHKSDDEKEDVSKPNLTDKDLLCPYYAHGHCPYEDNCTYIHGDLCDVCQLPKLHPTDVTQREHHRMECLKDMEKNMEHSFAVHDSKDKECCICLEVVLEKVAKSSTGSATSKNQFGILENCTHCFCLDCIRRWRSDKSFGKNVRVCPICRVHSDFVTPSNVWVEDEESKKKVIQDYKDNLRTKHCHYFKHGKGECPFNEKCFYKHAYPDGTIASPKPRRKPRRQINADGELSFRETISLWDFLERREDGLISLEDELSLFLLGLLHDDDDDDDVHDFLFNFDDSDDVDDTDDEIYFF